jgi:hypothetical protein
VSDSAEELLACYRGLRLLAVCLRDGGVPENGILTLENVAASLGTSRSGALQVLAALEAHDVVHKRGAEWSVATSDERIQFLWQLLDVDVKLEREITPSAARNGRENQDALAVATGVGPHDPGARAEIARELHDLPVLGPRLAAPARYLELGCGRGAMLCSLLEANTALCATAVERSASVLEVLRETAEALGVLQRLELVRAELPADFPTGLWDVVYWSQAFSVLK